MTIEMKTFDFSVQWRFANLDVFVFHSEILYLQFKFILKFLTAVCANGFNSGA